MIKAGMPLKFLSKAQEGPGWLSSAAGTMVVLDNAPHPDAARIYVNWLLSREGQTAWSKATGLPSRRLDVPTQHLDPVVVPEAGLNYIRLDDEPSVTVNTKAAAKVVNELFK